MDYKQTKCNKKNTFDLKSAYKFSADYLLSINLLIYGTKTQLLSNIGELFKTLRILFQDSILIAKR
jgi:hypothetical protein